MECARGIVLLTLTTDRREALRGFRATTQLLVDVLTVCVAVR